MLRLAALAALLLSAPLAAQDAPFIIIDPGHGGNDVGIVHGGEREKEITLDAALRIADALRAEGLNVRLTREGDRHVSLRDRQAAGEGAALFLSVHVSGDRPGRGTLVFVPRESERSREYAHAIAAGVMGAQLTETVSVREASFVVLRGPSEASVMIELGGVGAEPELSRFVDGAYLDGLASAVAQALRERAL